MANGIESPTIKRKAGKMVSAKPSRSSPSRACSSQSGTRLSRIRSFTKIMNSMVRARKASMEASRRRGVTAIVVKGSCQEFFHIEKPVDHPARIAIFVVEPGNKLDLPPGYRGQVSIDHTGMCIAFDVQRYQRLFRILQDAFVRVARRCTEQPVDLVHRYLALQLHGDIRHGAVG